MRLRTQLKALKRLEIRQASLKPILRAFRDMGPDSQISNTWQSDQSDVRLLGGVRR